MFLGGIDREHWHKISPASTNFDNHFYIAAFKNKGSFPSFASNVKRI